MSDPYIGEIRMFAGNFAPNGWLFCQGQLLAISDYDTLFNLVGTTYGGDGESTFALPDLQSRIPLNPGNGVDQTYQQAQTGGVEQVTLTTNQIPAHSHALNASASAAIASSPANATWGAWPDGQYAPTPTGEVLAADTLSSFGGGQAHENMPPYLAVNFIISLFGIYPSQS